MIQAYTNNNNEKEVIILKESKRGDTREKLKGEKDVIIF